MIDVLPPQAAQIEHVHEKFGDRRSDPYHWMRERSNPKVIEHLRKENAYAEAVLKPTQKLQKELFQEMKNRTVPNESSAPVQIGNYFYFWQYLPGKEHAVFRRKRSLKAKESELLLDGNALAKGQSYFDFGHAAVSPDATQIAYTVDLVGRRLYELRVRDLVRKKDLAVTVQNTSGDVLWAADGATLFYVSRDVDTLRADKARRLHVPTQQDTLVFVEKDPAFQLSLEKSISKRHLFLVSFATLTTEYRVLPADQPLGEWKLLQPREKGHQYSMEEAFGSYYIRTNWNAPNHRLMKTSLDKPLRENWQELIPEQKDASLEGFVVLKPALIYEVREKGLLSLKIQPLNSVGEFHKKARAIRPEEEAFVMGLGANREFANTHLRYTYESPVRPPTDYDLDLVTGKKIVVKQKQVPGFQPGKYRVRRLWIPARDGVQIPVTLVHLKKLKKLNRQPLFVYGYGSYGISLDPSFSSSMISLYDRGFVSATAHIRGGQELGRAWYDSGKLLKKMNTFYDFIDATEGMLKKKIGDPQRVYAMGGSAGGMLMGVVANQRPDLYRAMVAQVPFVDNLTTMLDESIPLTTFEYEEWGNPNEKKFYDMIKSYSVFDNVKQAAYPSILVRTGFHDSQVQYWEPMKWVARLRERNQGTGPILFLTEMDAGHGGLSGRYQSLKEMSLDLGYLIWQNSLVDKASRLSE